MLLVNDSLIAAHLADLAAAIDGGTGPGKLRAYSSPRPARGAAITTQTLIGETTLPDPVGTVSGNTLTVTAPEPLAIVNDGTIAWVRFVDSTGAFVADGSAGLTGSGADVELSRVADLQAGGYIDWTAFTITYPTS